MKFLIFLVISLVAQSQLSVNIVSEPISIDHTLELNFTVTDQNGSVNIDKENVLIKETLRSATITDFQKNNEQYYLKWIPNYNSITDNGEYSFSLIVSDDDERMGFDNWVIDDVNKPVGRLYVDNGAVTSLIIGGSEELDVQFEIRKRRNNSEPVRITSVESTYQHVRSIWVGGFNEPSSFSLPFDAIGNNYTFYLRLNEPFGDGPYIDKVSVNYDNGGKATYPLISGSGFVIRETELELTYPNDGRYYAPCDTVEVRWSPYKPGFSINVYLTNADGRELMGSTTDSIFSFTIPDELRGEYFIRVEQNDDNVFTQKINPNDIEAQKITLTDEGDQYLVADISGLIGIFSTATNSLIDLIQPPVISLRNYLVTDLRYTNDGFVYQFVADDVNYLAYYDFTLSAYTWLKVIPNNVPKSIMIDNDNNTIIYQSVYSNFLNQYDISTGDEKGKIVFEEFISDIDINFEESKAVVTFYNGDIRVYDYPNFDQHTLRYDFTGMRYIHTARLSPNGKYLALSFISDQKGTPVDYWVIDISQDKLIGTFRGAATNPLDVSFNASSNFLVVASPTVPTVLTYDLFTTNDPDDGLGNSEGVLTAASFAKNRSIYVFSSTSQSSPLSEVEFIFPEVDISDNPIRIENPMIADTVIEIEEYPIFTTTSFVIEGIISNIGNTNLLIEEAYFEDGTHFSNVSQDFKERLLPGEVHDVIFDYRPIDIGLITDTLIIETCDTNYRIPVNASSRLYNLSFSQNPIDFGELCVGVSDSIVVDIFRNDDTYPFRFTEFAFENIDQNVFEIKDFAQPQTIQPGESLSAKIVAEPDRLGEIIEKVRINFDAQNRFYNDFDLRVEGIGALLEFDNNNLSFIPEEPERTLILTNSGEVDIDLNGLSFSDQGIYEITDINKIPLTLTPGESVEFAIRWLDTSNNDITFLLLDTDPCPLFNNLPVASLQGSIFFNGTEIIAENPYSEIEIPISIFQSTNYKYNDEADFEVILTSNPRLFFPTGIRSKYDFSEYENLGINNEGLRETRILVNGNFNISDTIAYLEGVTGIAETDRTIYSLHERSIGLSQNIDLNTNDGEIIINNIYEDRRILHPDNFAVINNVYPNPSSDFIEVILDSKKESEFDVKIIDLKGSEIKNYGKIKINSNENQLRFNVEDINAGSYLLEFRNASGSINASINIIK